MMEMVSQILRQGVVVHHPESVFIDSTVRPENIAPGVVIHAGCRIGGQATSIGPGCILGAEGPLTLDHCQLGASVTLGGGFFSHATLLDQVSMGDGAHVRPGTLLEEQASCGHTVGFKQTILMPFAVTGSLINFCDCLLAGGTSRTNHSEVGSSYVHFNYTPHQDKATPSLLGDVPRGVMLDQPPIFLGGQGGLVGPTRLAFGTIIAAGLVFRRDVTKPGQLVFGGASHAPTEIPFNPKRYGDVTRVLANNFAYLGNLVALLEWYRRVRTIFLPATPHGAACLTGAFSRLESGIDERVKRLTELATRLRESVADAAGERSQAPYRLQHDFAARWADVRDGLRADDVGRIAPRDRDAFLAAVEATRGTDSYTNAIRNLRPGDRTRGTAWLQAIVDHTISRCTS